MPWPKARTNQIHALLRDFKARSGACHCSFMAFDLSVAIDVGPNGESLLSDVAVGVPVPFDPLEISRHAARSLSEQVLDHFVSASFESEACARAAVDDFQALVRKLEATLREAPPLD